MRGWGGVAAFLLGCTAPNPAFDRFGGTGEGSAEGGEVSATGSEGSEGGGSSESGGIPLVCPPFYDGPPAIASATIQDGQGNRVCGGSVAGALVRPDPQVVNEYVLECDAACGSCPAGPYQIVFGNGDPNLGPSVPCVQVFLAGEMLDGGCTFNGIGVLDEAGGVLYGAGSRESLFDPLLSAAIPITVAMHEPCRCEGTDCCTQPPGSYKMKVETTDAEVVVYEGEIGFPNLEGRAYEFLNLRAHVHQECGGEEHFDWVARQAL